MASGLRKRTKKADDNSAVATAADVSKMKVAELKAELGKRGLDKSGKKADLVEKLKDAMGDATDSSEKPLAKQNKSKEKDKQAVRQQFR